MRARQGFTLVEMLVAMALTLFVMTILSQAFVAALDTFRGLKAIGDMDEGLRTTANILRSDLLMDHMLDVTDTPIRLKSYKPPTSGFFRIYQGAAGTVEPTDWESISSYANSTMVSRREPNHVLHFSVYANKIYQAGGTLVTCRPENFFIAAVPLGSKLLANPIDNVYPQGSSTPYRAGNTISGQWAEVGYFLFPQGSTSAPNSGSIASGGTPLYKLYRSQFLVISNNTAYNSAPNQVPYVAGTYNSVSWKNPSGANFYFNLPSDLAAGTRRFDPTSPSITDSTGASIATLLLNNVVSFAVQAMKPGDSDFSDITVYDTNGDTTSIVALQICIRVWDAKTQSSRQITIIQDM